MKKHKHKDTETKQINVVLSGLQFDIVSILGGPTKCLNQFIEDRAGDSSKLRLQRQRSVEIIEEETARIAEIDSMISRLEAIEAEERRLMEEAERKAAELRSKKPKIRSNSNGSMSKEKWIASVKPRYKKILDQDGRLTDENYNIIMEHMGFSTHEEVDSWLNSSELN